MKLRAVQLVWPLLLTWPTIALAIDEVAPNTVVTPYIGDGLELAVIPCPREAELKDRLIRVGRLEVQAPANYAHPFTLVDAQALTARAKPPGDPAQQPACPLLLGELGTGCAAERVLAAVALVPDAEKLKQMGPQGYVLYCGPAAGYEQGVAAIAGVGPAGTLYALQSLKQMAVARDGWLYLRQARIVDWPAMDWRGSKRPQAWEYLYKANFGGLSGHSEEQFRIYPAAGSDPQRELKSWELGTDAKRTASSGLDASDALIDSLFQRFKSQWRPDGPKIFMVKGDDIELGLDQRSGTQARFKGNVGAAFVHLLTELNKRLKQLDPECTLYWMPNPYYTVNWDFERLSREVREAGGVPSDIGLWWTGHYVFSAVMTEQDLRAYQRAFYGDNEIRVRGFIYDNHGRATEPAGRLADYFAMPARDPAIAKCIRGLSNERGSWINRITSYDFQWNPEAYDPDRSLKLAVRELAAGDPAYYRALLEFVQTWESGRYPSTRETDHAAVTVQQQQHAARLQALLPTLESAGKAALANVAPVPGDKGADFRSQLLAEIATNVKLKCDMLASIDQMWRDAPGSAWRIPAEQAPTIDGRLDDACYQRAPTFEKFLTGGAKMNGPVADGQPLWEIKPGTVPGELDTQGWLLADEKHLYLAFRCRDKAYARPPGQVPPNPIERERVGNDNPYCWRQPCLDIVLDVRHDHENLFHMVVDPLGQKYDEYLGWPGDPLPTGPRWTLGDNYKVVRDGDGWLLEAAVPLESLGQKQAMPGDVWGVNVFRIGINAVSMLSVLKDTGPYGLRYPKALGHVSWK